MSSATKAFLAVALLSFLAASALHVAIAFGSGPPGGWHAMVHLLVMGWASGMILAVLHRVVPVFTGRDFPFAWLPPVNALALAAGVTVTTVGWLLPSTRALIVGFGIEALAAVTFATSLMLLFSRGAPRAGRPPAPPFDGQDRVDATGTLATKLSLAAWLVGLGILLAQQASLLSQGWFLAGEHVLLLGWVLLMVMGVAYHVLPRFSGTPIRGARWAKPQVLMHAAGIALVAPGIGLTSHAILAPGALLIAISLGAFGWMIAPTLKAVGAPPRTVSVALPVKEPR